jgi:arylformamidase
MPMPDLDLETEYSPRLTVTDHAQIFARWAREAEDYRAEMLKAGRAELGISYGESPRQFIDLFFPAAGEGAPLAVFIHGGYWRAMDPSFHSHMARGLNERGFAVGVVGYDLCPIVSIADIIEQIRRACASLWQRFNRRMLISGHSAGGHLTAAMVATDWQKLWPKVPSDLVPVGYAISGVFDLTPLTKTSMNQDFRLDDAEARRISPIFWTVPAGRTLDAAVGDLESSEFKRQSRSMSDAWRQAKAETRYAELPGNHFTVIDALADPRNAMVARMAELARRISA